MQKLAPAVMMRRYLEVVRVIVAKGKDGAGRPFKFPAKSCVSDHLLHTRR